MPTTRKNKFSFVQLDSQLTTLLAIFCIGIGVCVRLIGNTTAPITGDEYYTAKSLQAIIDTGLPLLGDSGLYIRGILQQYLTLPFVWLLNSVDNALRIIPFVANIITGCIIYKLCVKQINPHVGLLCLVLFSLSVWQIEFSRFARMYSLFSCLFALSVFLTVSYFNHHKIRHLYWLLLVCILSPLVYEGCVFIMAITAATVLIHHQRLPARAWALFVLSLILLLLLKEVDWRHLFESGSFLPLDYHKKPSTGLLLLPKHLLLFSLSNPVKLLAISAFVATIAIYHYLTQRIFYPNTPPIIRFATITLLGLLLLFNQLFLLVLLIMLIKLLDSVLKTKSLKLDPRLLLPLLLWLPLFTIAFFNLELSIHDMAVALIKYPNIFDAFLYQWAVFISPPFLAASMTLIGWGAVTINKQQRQTFHLLLLIALACIVLLALIKTPYFISRYSFFLHPIYLLLLCWSFTVLSEKLRLSRLFNALCLLLLYWAGTSDLSLYHLININQPEIIFRKHYSEQLGTHLINRRDLPFLTQWINERQQPGDIIISQTHEFDHFYQGHFFRYESRDSNEFINYSSHQGTKESWSTMPLLHSPEQLTTLALSSPHNVWYLFYKHKNPELVSKYADKAVYSFDGTLGVINLKTLAYQQPRI